LITAEATFMGGSLNTMRYSYGQENRNNKQMSQMYI
jgi:hypothetical protein